MEGRREGRRKGDKEGREGGKKEGRGREEGEGEGRKGRRKEGKGELCYDVLYVYMYVWIDYIGSDRMKEVSFNLVWFRF